jgi:hypothetical protein
MTCFPHKTAVDLALHAAVKLLETMTLDAICESPEALELAYSLHLAGCTIHGQDLVTWENKRKKYEPN